MNTEVPAAINLSVVPCASTTTSDMRWSFCKAEPSVIVKNEPLLTILVYGIGPSKLFVPRPINKSPVNAQSEALFTYIVVELAIGGVLT